MNILLYSKNHASFLPLIEAAANYDHTIIESGQIAQASSIFFENLTPLVFFDYSTHDSDVLKLLDIFQQSERVFYVIFFISEYNPPLALQLLPKKIDAFLYIPTNMDDSLKIIKATTNFNRLSAIQVDFQHLSYEHKKIIIGNDFHELHSIIRQLTINLSKVCKNPKKIELALYEIIINAIEHGNLGITADEKKQSIQNDKYYQLLNERKLMEKFKKRKVYIETTLSDDYVEYVIEDEGIGFDWRKKTNNQEPIDLLNEHGRGILMVRNIFDIIEYNEKGNKVRMIKFSDFQTFTANPESLS